MQVCAGADGGVCTRHLQTDTVTDTVQVCAGADCGVCTRHLQSDTVTDTVWCRFVLEPTVECARDICSMFTVSPQHGTLSPTDRPATVQLTFHAAREVSVKDQPILRCHVVEPSIGDAGEMIASIPIKISVRSTFSKSVPASLLTRRMHSEPGELNRRSCMTVVTSLSVSL